MPTDPDLLLARRAAAGQEAAWEEIVDRYGERIYNLALSFTHARAEAEDLTQEVFLRLFQSLARYRGDVPLAGWALRLSRNLCIDHWRRGRLERAQVRVSEEALAALPSAGQPQLEAQERERSRALHAALAALPDELAEIVLLRDLEGWSGAEAAAYLEVPEGTVKSRLHRARQALAESLRPHLAPLGERVWAGDGRGR